MSRGVTHFREVGYQAELVQVESVDAVAWDAVIETRLELMPVDLAPSQLQY